MLDKLIRTFEALSLALLLPLAASNADPGFVKNLLFVSGFAYCGVSVFRALAIFDR